MTAIDTAMHLKIGNHHVEVRVVTPPPNVFSFLLIRILPIVPPCGIAIRGGYLEVPDEKSMA